jgi:hypothetical protein
VARRRAPARGRERRLSTGYKPFGAQVTGHQAHEDFVLVGGGWGSGKTTWLNAEGLRNTALNPGLKGKIVSPTYGLQRRTIQDELVKMLPEATRWPEGKDKARVVLGPMVKDWSEKHRVLTWWNDARWYFASAQIPGSLEGDTVAWLLVDEARLLKREAWEIAIARVRDNRSAKLRVSVASVPAMGWMWDEFGRGVVGRRYIRARTADNPYLPADYAKRLNLSDRMARAYLEGEFVTLEGLVFWTYEPKPASEGGSLLPVKVSPDRASYGALDFGGRSPYWATVQDVDVHDVDGGSLVAASAGTNTRSVECVVDEVVGSETLSRRHARAIADRLKAQGVVLTHVYCDPAGTARNWQTGLKDVQIYYQELKRAKVLRGAIGYTRRAVDVHIPNGVEVLRARLRDHVTTRHFFVADHLSQPAWTDGLPRGKVGVHGAFMGYAYPKDKPGEDEPAKDGIHDHACDALRYYAVNRHGVLEAPDIASMNKGGRAGEGGVGGAAGEDYTSW